jgi:hypothetical protein
MGSYKAGRHSNRKAEVSEHGMPPSPMHVVEPQPPEERSQMRGFKSLLCAGALLSALALAPTAKAQISFGINIGQPPVCSYGYYGYAPYDCAPYGYYGSDYFYNGVFLGMGPWANWGYGHGWGDHRYAGYGGRGYYGGGYGERGYGGRGYGGHGYGGGDRGYGGGHGGGHGGGGGNHGGGGYGGGHGGGGGNHGGGGHH